LYANLATCASDESCQLKLALAKHTQIFKYTSMSHLREIWELIDQFIPSLQAPRKRHRKATAWQKWLQWWDIASYSEQSVLYDNLKKIHQTTAVIAQRLYFTTNSLHTYTRLNSARASQVDSILFRQQEALLNITEIALHVTNSLFSTQVTIAAYEHIHILLNRIKDDIHLLIQGSLPLYLIPKNEFERTLAQIHANLSVQDVPLILPKRTYMDYISFHKFLVTRSGDNLASPNLIVTMELPLSLTETPFQLLKTYHFNLPVDNQQQHTCYISNVVNYIAYHPNSDYFLEFDEFPNIENDYYFLHRNAIVLKHKSQPTCTYALF